MVTTIKKDKSNEIVSASGKLKHNSIKKQGNMMNIQELSSLMSTKAKKSPNEKQINRGRPCDTNRYKSIYPNKQVANLKLQSPMATTLVAVELNEDFMLYPVHPEKF